MKGRATRNLGYSLVELTIAMSAGSAVMVLAIGLVHQSMSLSTLTRDRSEHQKSSSRLATQFRLDVGRADRCLLESPEVFRLQSGDRVISYSIEAAGVSRSESLDDARSLNDSFHLADGSVASFELDITEPPRAVLTLSANSRVGLPPRIDRRVEALVGRLSRLEQLPTANDPITNDPITNDPITNNEEQP